MKRFPWEWALGLIAGFGLSLIYAWVIAPARYVNTTPGTLKSGFKDDYRTMIAVAYASDNNLERAKSRLALLGDSDPVQALTAQAQRMLAAGQPFDEVQQIARLATDLGRGVASYQPNPTLTPASPTGIINTATSLPYTSSPPAITATLLPATATVVPSQTPMILDTPTPRPTRTPTPTPGTPFVLLSQDTVCNPNLTDGLLQITVLDSRHHQLPGVEIDITWSGGEEHFFTGFKPDIANGYADYVMQPGVTYSLRVAEAGTPITNLSAPNCTDSGGQSYPGGLHLTFQQP